MSENPRTHLKRMTRGLKFFGLAIVIVCFGGFGTWASLAPLSSAAIAIGTVSPDSSRKVIQHLEGGIISKILVQEGELVKAGQPMFELATKQAKANYSARWEQWMRLVITRERLRAQQTNSYEKFEFSDEQKINDNKDLKRFLVTQKGIFHLKNQMKKNQREIYEFQIAQVADEIASIDAQSIGLREQIELLEKEILDKKRLVSKGLTRTPVLYALQRRSSELLAEIASNNKKSSRAAQKGKEIQLSIHAAEDEDLDAITRELVEVNAEMAQIEEALFVSRDVLDRTVISAPVDGIVLNVRYKTVGGVIRPGEAILDIVPSNDDLIIDAKLEPNDIDNVYIGMPANVRISAFLARHVPMLESSVQHVAADVTLDSSTNTSYYAMKVKVKRDQFDKLNDKLNLTAGMSAEVFVMTGIHTPLDYIIDPIKRSFLRAFREESLNR